MSEYDWLAEDERGFFSTVVHGLRSLGWAKFDAEAEALERLQRRRESKDTPNAD